MTASQPMVKWIVKLVLSGDSITLRERQVDGPPKTKTINLAFVAAPKIGRRTGGGREDSKDEPGAFEAREFLRRRLVGKEVFYKHLYTVPYKSGESRDCGLIYDANDLEQSINELIVSEGLGEVLKRKQNEELPDYKKLIEIEEAAKTQAVGKWSSEKPLKIRTVLQDLKEKNANDLLNKTYDSVVVEYVASADQVKVALPTDNPNEFQMVTIRLAGIRCPSKDEPFFDESLFFVEKRLLQQEVRVRIAEMVKPKDSKKPIDNPILLGSIFGGKDGQQDLAVALVREGYAKLNDATLKHTENSKLYRETLAQAKQLRKRIWKDYIKEESSNLGSKSDYDARVLEIINGDALVVQSLADNTVSKVFFASLKPLKKPAASATTTNTHLNTDGKPQDGEQRVRPLYDIPYMYEAREFLRKRLIGKKIRVHEEYRVEKSDKFPEKICVSLSINGQDIAEGLLLRGLADLVLRPRENERPSNYDKLTDAYDKAQKSKKGIHSDAKIPGKRVNDLSSSPAKAKEYSKNLLKRESYQHEAIVEHVYSSTRVKLYIQKENCLVNFILQGVNAPKLSEDEKIGKEGLDHVKNHTYQRDVKITIVSSDKVGNFIGYLYYESQPNQFKNISRSLIELGLASLRDKSDNELKKLEQEAKEAHRGMWLNWTPEVEKVDEEDSDTGGDDLNGDAVEKDDNVENGTDKDAKRAEKREEDLSKRTKVVLTEIVFDTEPLFYAQRVDQGAKFEEMMNQLRENLNKHPPLAGVYTPKKGDVAVARFSADNQWYRAKVIRLDNSKRQAEVLFVDYGNKQLTNYKDLADIPSPKFSVTSQPPAAQLYGLAFVSLPVSDEDDVRDATDYFSQWSGRQLLLKVEYKDSSQTAGTEMVTIFDAEKKEDVGLKMVREGYVFLKQLPRNRRERSAKTLADYQSGQEQAKTERLNIWRYGDSTEDDAREFGSLR